MIQDKTIPTLAFVVGSETLIHELRDKITVCPISADQTTRCLVDHDGLAPIQPQLLFACAGQEYVATLISLDTQWASSPRPPQRLLTYSICQNGDAEASVLYAGRDAEIDTGQDAAKESQERIVLQLEEAIARLAWARGRAAGWHMGDAQGGIGEVMAMLEGIVGERKQDKAEEAMDPMTFQGVLPVLPQKEGLWSPVYDARRRCWMWLPCAADNYPGDQDES